jgi:beta-glucanase (GH16 family)
MRNIIVFAVVISFCFSACGNGDDNLPEEKPDGFAPKDYTLVWADEFNDSPNGLPGADWWFETGNHGWGNNEEQNYVAGVLGTDTVAKIQNGILTITAYKLNAPYQGSDIISTRMNTRKAWTYGYFEMRAKMPSGRGTWPAFWMLPENFQTWPLDGEIDIMEYVGYRPDVTQASVHCQAYNGAAGNNKTDTRPAPKAEQKFYTYGLLWTADKITAYIEGIPYFTYENDRQNNKATWPFNVPFYLKLNLAIGGNWGGQQGVDPNIFPARYEIDYVRVYQKK